MRCAFIYSTSPKPSLSSAFLYAKFILSHSCFLGSLTTFQNHSQLKIQANPADILLFHRRKLAEKGGKGGAKNASSRASVGGPVEPEDLEDFNIEDLVVENLTTLDKKLEMLDERRLGIGAYTSMCVRGGCRLCMCMTILPACLV